MGLDATFTLAVEEGVLTLRRRGAGPQRLTRLVRDEFTAGQAIVSFVRATGDEVTGCWTSAGSATCRFERVR